MRTTQYVAIDRRITAAETGSIRERWMYGLRLLRDPEAIAPGGGLRHGVTDQLIAAAKAHGIKLSATEIRRRLLCARAYPTEAQIVHAVDDFETWRDLSSANFPPYEDEEFDDEPADSRTPAERKRDLAKKLLEQTGMQEALFPLDQFEPAVTKLGDLFDYRDRQQAITDGFIATGERRREYLEALAKAVDNDMSKSWQEAHLAAFGTDDVEDVEDA
jgi:hypothetical protein